MSVVDGDVEAILLGVIPTKTLEDTVLQQASDSPNHTFVLNIPRTYHRKVSSNFSLCKLGRLHKPSTYPTNPS